MGKTHGRCHRALESSSQKGDTICQRRRSRLLASPVAHQELYLCLSFQTRAMIVIGALETSGAVNAFMSAHVNFNMYIGDMCISCIGIVS